MKELSICALERPLRDAPAAALRVKQDTPRDPGADEDKERARNRLTGVRTRGSPEPTGLLPANMGQRYVRFKALSPLRISGGFARPFS